MILTKQDIGVWVKERDNKPKTFDKFLVRLPHGRQGYLWHSCYGSWLNEDLTENKYVIEWLKPIEQIYVLTKDDLVKLLHEHLDDEFWQTPEDFIESITAQ